MAKTEQINVMVSPETEQEWKEEVAENPEVSNVSDLIRTSVSRRLSGMYDMDNMTADTPGSDGPATLPDEVLTQLDRIEESIGSNRQLLRTIDKEIQAEPDSDPVDAQTVLAVVPKQEYRMRQIPESDGGGKVRENKDPNEFAPTADELADQLGKDTEAVREKLDYLAEEMGVIQRGARGQGEGKYYYWRSDK